MSRLAPWVLVPHDNLRDLCDVNFALHYCPLKALNGVLLPIGWNPNSLETDKAAWPTWPVLSPASATPVVQLCTACSYQRVTHSLSPLRPSTCSSLLPGVMSPFCSLECSSSYPGTLFVVTPLHYVHLCIITYHAAHLLVCLCVSLLDCELLEDEDWVLLIFVSPLP